MAEHSFDFNFDDRAISGKVILLAGGSGGLGSAAAALLARDGAIVVVGYRNNRQRAEALKEAIAARYGATIHLVEGDILDPTARARYIQTADALGQGLYGLVCLTGDPARLRFDQASDSDLEASIRENYIAPLLLARDFAARILERGTEGSIVFISSMQAVAPFESSINYAGPKSALIHAARIMAKQSAGRLRVNVVAPGVCMAGMALSSIRSGKYDHYIERKIITRFGRPEDIARVIRLLLEPDNYITGQVITVDGGLTLRRDLG